MYPVFMVLVALVVLLAASAAMVAILRSAGGNHTPTHRRLRR
jgi:hypothetical protein